MKFLFIEKNKTKLDKIVWTANDEGSKILVNRSMTDGDEGRFVASTIFETKMNNQMANRTTIPEPNKHTI